MKSTRDNIVDEISREEIFKDAPNDLSNDPNAVFVEESPDMVLKKLLEINTLPEPEK